MPAPGMKRRDRAPTPEPRARPQKIALERAELEAECAELVRRWVESAERSSVGRADRRRARRNRVLTRLGLGLVAGVSLAAGVAIAAIDEEGVRLERSRGFALTAERVVVPDATPPGNARGPTPARARIATARDYAASRLGSVSFGIIDSEGRASDMHGGRRYVTASVVKAMLLIAELDRLAASGASLDSGTRGVLDAMITYSDNAAADSIYGRVGDAGLYAVAEDAGLENFAVTGYWANAQLTATDMARLMGRLDSLLAGPHAEYGSGVLGRVITAQRWGIPAAVAGDGWNLRFKGGWRPTESGELVHQIASLSRDATSVSLAVLTDGNPTMAYGVETVRGVAERLLSPEPERRGRGERR